MQCKRGALTKTVALQVNPVCIYEVDQLTDLLTP